MNWRRLGLATIAAALLVLPLSGPAGRTTAATGEYSTWTTYLADYWGAKAYRDLTFTWGPWFQVGGGAWQTPIYAVTNYLNVMTYDYVFSCSYQQVQPATLIDNPGVSKSFRWDYWSTPDNHIVNWNVAYWSYGDIAVNASFASNPAGCGEFGGGAVIHAAIQYRSNTVGYLDWMDTYTSYP